MLDQIIKKIFNLILKKEALTVTHCRNVHFIAHFLKDQVYVCVITIPNWMKVSLLVKIEVESESGGWGHSRFRFNFNFHPIFMALTVQNTVIQTKAELKCPMNKP